jgi:catechol 2,3-dioxygenase-like lactoylglutathione lyase family enzyme
MAVTLDHLLVPSKDRVASARMLAHLLDVPWAEQAPIGPFSPVYVNASLTLDFDTWPEPVPQQHFAFKVDDADFDAIFARIKAAGLPYRSSPVGPDDFQVHHGFGGRMVYWREADGHVWEILTVSYARRAVTPGIVTSVGE